MGKADLVLLPIEPSARDLRRRRLTWLLTMCLARAPGHPVRVQAEAVLTMRLARTGRRTSASLAS